MYLLSVIIPVYNAEKYLNECLEPLIRMGDRVQIVLADDDSTDNSYSICESYASRHNNIVLLHQKNSGPSGARNLALSRAEGKYIVFCDADDWLDDGLIWELEKYEEQDIDFFQFAIKNEFDLLYHKVTFLNEEQKKELFALIVGLRDNRNLGHGYFGLVTCKVFKRELVRDIQFDPKVVGEDTLYAVQAYSRINTAVFLPCRFYFYRILEGSYSRRHFPGIVPMATRMLEEMRSEIPDWELMVRAYNCHAVDKFWWCLYATTEDMKSFRELSSRLKELYRIPVFYSAIKKCSVRPMGLMNRVKYTLLRAGLLKLLAFLISVRG